MEKIVSKYLKLSGVYASKKYIEKIILSHPTYPSLLSISEAFESIGVEYNFIKTNISDIYSIDFPFLLHSNNNGGELLLINNQIELNSTIKNITNNWTGIVIKTNGVENILTTESENYLRREVLFKRLVYLIIATILILYLYSNFVLMSLQFIFLFSTNLIALFIGVQVLLKKTAFFTYESVNRFCIIGKSFNCDKVFYSLNNKIPLPEIVLTYFLYQFVLLFLYALNANYRDQILNIFILNSILTIPFILFSILYQSLILKVFCLLCIAIVCVLLLQIFILFPFLVEKKYLFTSFSYDFVVYNVIIVFFLYFSILLISKILYKIASIKNEEIANNRLKYSTSVFEMLLSQNKSIQTNQFPQNIILIGNHDAPIELFIVISIDCQSCGDSLIEAIELVFLFENIVNLKIHITTINNTQTFNEELNYFSAFLSEIQDWKCVNAKNAIKSWYSDLNLKKFKKKYPLLNFDELNSNYQNEKDLNWKTSNDILKTPSLFYNKYLLPDYYKISDLKYIIPSKLAQ